MNTALQKLGIDGTDLPAGAAVPTESRIYVALDGVCTFENMKVYKYIPPQMVRYCEDFLDKYGEFLEDVMVSSVKDRVDIEYNICNRRLKTCRR